MKIIFFGTPDFVVPILEALHKKYNGGRERELIAVCTQPPKPVGRDKKLEYSAVDKFAHLHKIDIYHNADELPDFDLGVCAAYGKIIPDSVIQKAKSGILNIHPSLLPKYRGASPIQATIASGDLETGVTVLKMDSEMDHGPIVSSFKDEVHEAETNEELRERLFMRSAEFLINLIPHYMQGNVRLKEQNHADATFTKTITKDDGFIEPSVLQNALNGEISNVSKKIRFLNDQEVSVDASFIERLSRAFNPWPGVHTTIKLTPHASPMRLKILSLHTTDNQLFLDSVQLEGKNPVSWEQFTRGYPEATFK